MDDIKDSLIQTIRERFGNPMWGYIALSWLGFNWKNIAILFVSKSTIEERIKVVTSQDYLYLHYLIIPVVVGCVLAASSPYIKWAFSRRMSTVNQCLMKLISVGLMLHIKRI